jgi:hypothetical protein
MATNLVLPLFAANILEPGDVTQQPILINHISILKAILTLSCLVSLMVVACISRSSY